jgi:hypothetical protein
MPGEGAFALTLPHLAVWQIADPMEKTPKWFFNHAQCLSLDTTIL